MNTAEPLTKYLTAEEQRLAEENKRLRELLKPLAFLSLTGVKGETVYQRDSTKILVIDVINAKKALEGHI